MGRCGSALPADHLPRGPPCLALLLLASAPLLASADGGSSSSDDDWKNIVCSIVIGISSLLLVLVSYRIFVLHRAHRAAVSPSIVGGAAESDETTKRNWKIDYSDLELGALIGQGSIGKVYKGRWRGLTVAVKEILHTAKEDEVHEELQLLIRVRHPNLCLFMGLAMPSAEKLCLVSEHMSRGNLYTVLHDRSIALDWRRRVSMALDAARAMNYLHCSRPVILHKNLNSINLLVDAELVTKVCDYAVDTIRTAAKKSGVYTQPLWVAPELFKAKSKPTKASDVYSFGILLWEIVTRRTPYQGSIRGGASNNIKALQEIAHGLRPAIPDRCPSKMSDLMRRCWHADPTQRPDFQTIVEDLTEMSREKPVVHDAANAWLRSQTELEEIAIASDEGAELASLLTGDQKKPWMVASAELKYEEVIGRGSFGEVWSGTFRGKKVAIKKLMQATTAMLKGSAHLAAGGRPGSSALKAFVKELNLMCSLRHPQCVLFMGACLEEGNYAIVMEYCSRGTLFDILHDVSQSIDYTRILKVLHEVAEGVQYLHMHKPPILHRDLKSLNILVDEDWNVKVSDFGLTEFKPESGVLGLGTSDMQVGTPFWQAPECMERGEFSEASDVYAFGMIVHELFTREVPFRNMNPHQAALAVISEDKRPDIPNFVPPKFAALIQQCWLRDPRARPTFPQVIERLSILQREGLPRIELSLSCAALYRKKTMVFAFKSKDAAIVYKTWGVGQSKKGDWVLVGPGDDVYTCDAEIFQKTYSLVDPSKPHLYRKTGSIFALEMKRDFLMETLEGMEHGAKGDWIAQNPVDGEQWPISAKSFADMYELSPSQDLPPNSRSIGKTPLGALQEEKETQEAEENDGLIQRKKGN